MGVKTNKVGGANECAPASRKARVAVILLRTFLFAVLVSVFPLAGFMNVAVPGSAHAADINYIYDELGRLRAVVDPNSDTAVYNYDAVGNLLSITRQASTLVSVIEFTPNSGPVGMTVIIYGTGFSATPTARTPLPLTVLLPLLRHPRPQRSSQPSRLALRLGRSG